jgi:hypothetical protein
MAAPTVRQTGKRFAGLLLTFRGRTHLSQRALAARAEVSLRSQQDWEMSVSYPTAERLRALIATLLDAGGFTAGRKRDEAESLCAAALHESPRTRAPFDKAWLENLLVRTWSQSTARDPHDDDCH